MERAETLRTGQVASKTTKALLISVCFGSIKCSSTHTIHNDRMALCTAVPPSIRPQNGRFLTFNRQIRCFETRPKCRAEIIFGNGVGELGTVFKFRRRERALPLPAAMRHGGFWPYKPPKVPPSSPR